MRKIGTVVIVLVLVLVAAPWGIGRVAEQRVNAGLDQLVQEAPYLTIVERKWTPGWFRSEQEVTFEVFGDLSRALAAVATDGAKQETALQAEGAAAGEVEPVTDAGAEPTAEVTEGSGALAEEAPADEAAAAAAPLRFTVRNEILHGPVLWPAGLGLARVNSKLVLSDEIRKGIVEFFGTDEPLRISTRVGFFGGGTTSFIGEGRSIKIKDGTGTLAYDSFKLNIGYARNFDKISMDGGWPKVEASSPDGENFLMRGMRINGDSKRVRGELYDTDFNFVIDEMNITGKDHMSTGIANIHYIVSSSLDDDFMDVGARLGSGKITSPPLEAMQLNLDEVHYDFTLRHLHAESLDKLVTAIKASYKQPVADPAVLNAVWMAPFKEHGLEVLKHDPELLIDRMGVVTPEGEGVIKGIIRLKGVTAEDFAENSMALLAKVDADFTVEVAQKLIDKIPNGATGAGLALDQGYAKREGDKLVSHIEFKKGELRINGKAQGIPGLGGPPPSEGEPPVATPPQE